MRFGIALVSLAVLSISPAAEAVTMDFESLEVIGGGNTSVGGSYTEDGFLLTEITSTNPHLQFFETLNLNYPGSTALFFGEDGMAARLESVSGSPFDFSSIELAHMGSGGGSIGFTGHFAAGGTIFQGFSVPTGDLELVTFTFSGFENLNRLEWTEEFHNAHQFDNIVVSIVPEPSTALLLASGLVAMAAGRTRRNNTGRR